MITKLKLLIGLLLLMANGMINAQTILLEQEPGKDTIPETYGQNLKNFSHFYYGLGFIAGAGDNNGLKINYFMSNELTLGLRYKRKVNNFYALGADINCSIQNYNINQNSLKTFPNAILHDKEKLLTRELGLEFYNRFNFGKRGNYIGNFIDLAAYGQWDFFPTYVTIDNYKSGNAALAKKTKQIHSSLTYTNPFNYGLTARIGFNKYVFYGSYRLSNIFKDSSQFPELPGIIIGIQLGLHG